jgi:hypothetical protein
MCLPPCPGSTCLVTVSYMLCCIGTDVPLRLICLHDERGQTEKSGEVSQDIRCRIPGCGHCLMGLSAWYPIGVSVQQLTWGMDRKRVTKEWRNGRLIGIFYSQIYAELCTTTVVRDQYDVPGDTASLL